MRILDMNSNKALNNICVYLTLSEAKNLMSSIEDLLEDKLEPHVHIYDDIYQHEITITIYDEKNLHSYNERSKKLIFEDQ